MVSNSLITLIRRIHATEPESRRMRLALLAAAAALLLAGCNNYARVPDPKMSARDSDLVAMVPHYEVDMNFNRYELDDPTGKAPGNSR